MQRIFYMCYSEKGYFKHGEDPRSVDEDESGDVRKKSYSNSLSLHSFNKNFKPDILTR